RTTGARRRGAALRARARSERATTSPSAAGNRASCGGARSRRCWRAMNDVTRPLTDDELDRLDRFLLDRVPEDADTEGKDESVLGISEPDGFLAAILSGPVALDPDRWLPVMYGDFAPVGSALEEFDEVLSLILRHLYDLADLLAEYPDEFEP